ncbi:MAG: hypothetical protein UX09_C0020G0001 [Candidatus Uhrbacteria bacterium GW2011_GWE2_45_35]|uniref:Uncharacterized protein n=1 Tax=Candidatus Uhrbacteria bacterium GW2011_GWE2_45_35 TaxID=1618993 RepID=A0A0G1QHL8_9BACT|nr:MAG: hypothetical protein UX09_C0020G0001 [Candidatus Uhrbacteria bacterium GW2011_GWE2_45_35]
MHPIKNLKKLRALNGSLHSWQGKRREHTHERARTHSDSKAECKEARDEAPDYTLELGIKHEVLLRAKRLTFLTPVRFTTTLFGARQIFQIFEKLDKHRQIKRDLKPEVPRLIRQLPRYFFRFPEICSSLSFLLTIRFWGQDDFQKLAMNKFPGLTKLTQSSQHGQSGHGEVPSTKMVVSSFKKMSPSWSLVLTRLELTIFQSLLMITAVNYSLRSSSRQAWSYRQEKFARPSWPGSDARKGVA